MDLASGACRGRSPSDRLPSSKGSALHALIDASPALPTQLAIYARMAMCLTPLLSPVWPECAPKTIRCRRLGSVSAIVLVF